MIDFNAYHNTYHLTREYDVAGRTTFTSIENFLRKSPVNIIGQSPGQRANE